MNALAVENLSDVVEEVSSFNVQVCSYDGRLLDEYTLDHQADNVETLAAAENHIRDGLSDYKGDPLLIFVSQNSSTDFHQLQIKVTNAQPDVA